MVIDDKDRHKPFGKTAWAPVDDVYILRYYPRTIINAGDAIDMLKNFQQLDFTPMTQPLYIDLRLNMKLEKKVISSKTATYEQMRFSPIGSFCSYLKTPVPSTKFQNIQVSRFFCVRSLNYKPRYVSNFTVIPFP